MNLYDNNWLYDLVHEKSATSEEVAFYERQIERYGSPVLELACGSGNYLVTLSQDDVEISGLDISGEMLHGAQQRAENQNAETNLINADMRSFELNRKASYFRKDSLFVKFALTNSGGEVKSFS